MKYFIKAINYPYYYQLPENLLWIDFQVLFNGIKKHTAQTITHCGLGNRYYLLNYFSNHSTKQLKASPQFLNNSDLTFV